MGAACSCSKCCSSSASGANPDPLSFEKIDKKSKSIAALDAPLQNEIFVEDAPSEKSSARLSPYRVVAEPTALTLSEEEIAQGIIVRTPLDEEKRAHASSEGSGEGDYGRKPGEHSTEGTREHDDAGEFSSGQRKYSQELLPFWKGRGTVLSLSLQLSKRQLHRFKKWFNWRPTFDEEVATHRIIINKDGREEEHEHCLASSTDEDVRWKVDEFGFILKKRFLSEHNKKNYKWDVDLTSSRIKQGSVGDCSFLAVLNALADCPGAVKILRELFVGWVQKDRIILVKMYVDGQFHIVPVAPTIPVGNLKSSRFDKNTEPSGGLNEELRRLQILCAHSKNTVETWISFLEKAYVMLCGGNYDFAGRGSNPNTDGYHLTGWMPETLPVSLFLKTQTKVAEVMDEAFSDRVWTNMREGLRTGSCVICLGTGAIADAVVEKGSEDPEGVSVKYGIVQNHAYTVLRLHEIPTGTRAGGTCRLLYVKNPWGRCGRWKGRFSIKDSVWDVLGPEFQRLGLPLPNIDTDDGHFWIEWSDVLTTKTFSHVYILWNRTLLGKVRLQHSTVFDSVKSSSSMGRNKMEIQPYIDDNKASDDCEPVEIVNLQKFNRAVYNVQRRFTILPNDSSGCFAGSPQFVLKNPKPGRVYFFTVSRYGQRVKKKPTYLAIHAYKVRRNPRTERGRMSWMDRLYCPASSNKEGKKKSRSTINNDDILYHYSGVYTNGECAVSKIEHHATTPDPYVQYVFIVSQHLSSEEFVFSAECCTDNSRLDRDTVDETQVDSFHASQLEDGVEVPLGGQPTCSFVPYTPSVRRNLLEDWWQPNCGSMNDKSTYWNNPKFLFRSNSSSTDVVLVLKTSVNKNNHSINIRAWPVSDGELLEAAGYNGNNSSLFFNNNNNNNKALTGGNSKETLVDYFCSRRHGLSSSNCVGSSGPYRQGVCSLSLNNVQSNQTYVIVISMFSPLKSQLEKFQLEWVSTRNSDFTFERVGTIPNIK